MHKIAAIMLAEGSGFGPGYTMSRRSRMTVKNVLRKALISDWSDWSGHTLIYKNASNAVCKFIKSWLSLHPISFPKQTQYDLSSFGRHSNAS